MLVNPLTGSLIAFCTHLQMCGNCEHQPLVLRCIWGLLVNLPPLAPFLVGSSSFKRPCYGNKVSMIPFHPHQCPCSGLYSVEFDIRARKSPWLWSSTLVRKVFGGVATCCTFNHSHESPQANLITLFLSSTTRSKVLVSTHGLISSEPKEYKMFQNFLCTVKQTFLFVVGPCPLNPVVGLHI